MADAYAVILAGGTSSRMGENKLLARFSGMSVLERAVAAFACSKACFEGVVIAAGEGCCEEAARIMKKYPRISVVPGGSTRGGSVLNALRSLSGRSGVVAIHDAARCLVDDRVICDSVREAMEYGCAAAAIPVRDTLRAIDGRVTERDGLYCLQTPQTFELSRITAAYESASSDGLEYTDDLGVWLACGNEAHYSEGDIMNQKLTYNSDKAFFDRACASPSVRTGIGEDTHRLVGGRRLVLGGVDIAYEKGLLGHSDADVLTHAVIDAMLGAAALGDIGAMFPDSDPQYSGICSIELLKAAGAALCGAGFNIINIDATITAQSPKLAPHIAAMRKNIADALSIDTERVSVKATTTEGMNAEGRGECMTARAVCGVTR